LKNTIKVLIISSDYDLFTQLTLPLREPVFKVYFASGTEKELRSVVNNIKPDLIVVDPEIPSLRGIALSMLVRRWTPVPIMMLSTFHTRENEIRGLDLDADEYLSQPFNVSLIAARIDNILSLV
jgi:DNA-binding response OmpR family regulator